MNRVRLACVVAGLLWSSAAWAEPVARTTEEPPSPIGASAYGSASLSAFALPGGSPGIVIPDAEQVVLDGDTWRSLHDAANPPEPQPQGPRAATREVTITPTPDATPAGYAVEARWTLQTDRPAYFAGLVAGSDLVIDSATLDGKPAQLMSTPAGAALVVWIEREATLVVKGTQEVTKDDPLPLTLMPAVRGRIAVNHPSFVPSLVDTRQGGPEPSTPAAAVIVRKEVWSGDGQLTLRVSEPKPPPTEDGPTAIAHVGTGLTVGEGEVRGHARVVVEVRRGELPSLTLRVAGVGADLELDGRDVTRWNREGDRLNVELGAPLKGRTELDLTWSSDVARGDESTVPVPRVEVDQVFRADASLQIARDGELEVLPAVSTWTAISRDELPRYGQGLVEGTPTAAYRRSATSGELGSLRLVRFVPVPGPAVVVDVAAYAIATSAEGRVLARAHYEVRNERAANLRVSPPPGLEIIGARVAGETALPARTADGTWLIPLKRSLETVQGLLSFPVEVTLLGEVDAWERKEKRTLALPVVDAPVAVSRVTLHLPPEYESKLDPGDDVVVDAFTEGEGITYGLGFGEVGIAEADAQFQSAVQDYLANDFEAAQQKLDDLRAMGAQNENIDRLQSNVDLVTGKKSNRDKVTTTPTVVSRGEDGDRGPVLGAEVSVEKPKDSTVVADGQDAALARRIREQARARAGSEFEEQRKLEQEAEQAYRAGDYERAEERYAQAIDLGEQLENLEQEESVEQSRKNVALEEKLRSVKSTKERRAKQQGKAKKKRKVPAWMAKRAEKKEAKRIAKAERSSVSVYDFEDDNVDGEILSPQGANIASRARVTYGGSEGGGGGGGDDTKAAEIPEEETERAAEGEDLLPSRARARFDPVVTPAPPAKPEPMPASDPVDTADELVIIDDEADDEEDDDGGTYSLDGATFEPEPDVGRTVSMDEARNIPVGGRVSGGRLRKVGRSIGGLFKGRGRKVKTKARSRSRSKKDGAKAPAQRRKRRSDSAVMAGPRPPATEAPATPAERPPPPPPQAPGDPALEAGMDDWSMADSIPDPDEPADATGAATGMPVIEELPAPEATASALSVIIPAVGEAVLYQQLLIEAGVPQTIPIEARRPLRRRQKTRR